MKKFIFILFFIFSITFSNQIFAFDQPFDSIYWNDNGDGSAFLEVIHDFTGLGYADFTEVDVYLNGDFQSTIQFEGYADIFGNFNGGTPFNPWDFDQTVNISFVIDGDTYSQNFYYSMGGSWSIQPQNNSNSIWGSSNGFWGDDFTAVDVKESMQASVQATGVSIWPLFALMGIPLAFIIAYYLVDFMYYSVYLGQTSKISSQSPYLDKMVYRPYKGYNRLRSRAWNRANTLR